jgi:hypothetical protein
MKLVTWNCCRGDYLAKRELLSKLAPDVAVIQEARRTRAWPPGDLWFGPNPKNGLSVLTANGYSAEPLPASQAAPWSIVPIQITGPTRFNLLAVWTRKETGYVAGLAQALSTYSDFLMEEPSVVMGDFNANAIWDKPRAKVDFSRVAKRLQAEFGLVSVYHAHFGESFGVESQATHHFRWNASQAFHIDYCFVPEAWKIESVSIESDTTWGTVSDHRPLAVTAIPNQL